MLGIRKEEKLATEEFYWELEVFRWGVSGKEDIKGWSGMVRAKYIVDALRRPFFFKSMSKEQILIFNRIFIHSFFLFSYAQ